MLIILISFKKTLRLCFIQTAYIYSLLTPLYFPVLDMVLPISSYFPKNYKINIF